MPDASARQSQQLETREPLDCAMQAANPTLEGKRTNQAAK